MVINSIDNKIYTYDGYLKFSEDTIVEIIDGGISAMPPVPIRIHKTIVSKLLIAIGKYIEDNKGDCKIYTAPLDVVLLSKNEFEKNSKNTIQPDISVICDKSKLTSALKDNNYVKNH